MLMHYLVSGPIRLSNLADSSLAVATVMPLWAIDQAALPAWPKIPNPSENPV